MASAAEFVDTPKKRDFKIRRVCRQIYACERGERALTLCVVAVSMSSMNSCTVAALAVAVNHELADTLRDLVHQIETLTRETEQLAQQALQYRRDVMALRAVLAAVQDDPVEELLRNRE